MTPFDFYAGIDPRMGVLSFPFLFKDRAHANRTLADPAIAQKLTSLLDSKGIVGCGQIATADVRYMTRNPIHKIADFEGKKLRINGTDAEKERFRRVGATAIPMNLADMLTALQNKTIDGSGSGMTIWVNFNLETVSKELLQIEDTLIVAYCALSKRWLDTLPADLREVVVTESRAVFPRAIKITDDFMASLDEEVGRAGRQDQPAVRRRDEGDSRQVRHGRHDHHGRQARAARDLQRAEGGQRPDP